MEQIYTLPSEPKTALECVGRPIWERLFAVSMAYADTMSTDYVRLFGMPTVGDASLDKAIQQDSVDLYLTINAMVEHFKAGTPVRLRVHADSKMIYDIISTYLVQWKHQLSEGINIGDAPIDDLVTLDRFAASVFPYAVQHFNEEHSTSSLVQGLMGGGRYLSREHLFAPVPTGPEDAPAPYKHDSLEQLFAESVQTRGGSRWQ